MSTAGAWSASGAATPAGRSWCVLGPRLAHAARESHNDPAAQFLLAMQCLGTPQPMLLVLFPKEEPDAEAGGMVCVFNCALCDAREPDAPGAHALLQRSAAAGYAPSAAFLAAAGPDFRQPQRLLGALNEELASLLVPRADNNHESILSVVWRPPRSLLRSTPRERRHEVEAEVQAAARNLNATASPLKWRSRSVPCSHCGRPDLPTKACSGCYAASYCGAACQRADWGSHKQACRAAAAAGHAAAADPPSAAQREE
jgi:hypothetical protein